MISCVSFFKPNKVWVEIFGGVVMPISLGVSYLQQDVQEERQVWKSKH